LLWLALLAFFPDARVSAEPCPEQYSNLVKNKETVLKAELVGKPAYTLNHFPHNPDADGSTEWPVNSLRQKVRISFADARPHEIEIVWPRDSEKDFPLGDFSNRLAEVLRGVPPDVLRRLSTIRINASPAHKGAPILHLGSLLELRSGYLKNTYQLDLFPAGLYSDYALGREVLEKLGNIQSELAFNSPKSIPSPWLQALQKDGNPVSEDFFQIGNWQRSFELTFADVLTGKKSDGIRDNFHQRALIVELLARKPSGVHAWIDSYKPAFLKAGMIFSGVVLLRGSDSRKE